MPDIFVINSRGDRTPFARRHLIGSLIEAGIPIDIAMPRVARVADAIATLGEVEISTDNLRRALDVAAEGGDAAELGKALRAPIAHLPPPPEPYELKPGPLKPAALISATANVSGRFDIAYYAPNGKVRMSIRREDGAVVYAESTAGLVGAMTIGRELLEPGLAHNVDLLDGANRIVATTLLSPLWWPLCAPPPEEDPDADPDKEIERLQDELRRLHEDYDRFAEILKWFPLWRLSRILRAIKQLISRLDSFEVRLVIAFGKWLACSSEALADLSADELKKLLELLLDQLKLELESLEPGQDEEKRALEEAIRQVEARIRDWDATWTADKAREVLGELKAFFIVSLPALLRLLAGTWSEIAEELEKLGPAVARALISSVGKYLLKKLILKILERRLGAEMAKRLAPWVGLAIDVIEFLAILALVEKLNNISKAIDQRMVDLMLALKNAGWGWPNNFEHVWFKKELAGSVVRICAFKKCARRRPDGCVRWSAACPVKFTAGGANCKTVKLGNAWLNPDTGLFEIPYTIDPTSADAVCADGSTDPLLACYTFLRVSVWYRGANGVLNHHTSNIVIGVTGP